MGTPCDAGSDLLSTGHKCTEWRTVCRKTTELVDDDVELTLVDKPLCIGNLSTLLVLTCVVMTCENPGGLVVKDSCDTSTV